MNCKKKLKKVLCVVLAVVSVSSMITPVSYAVNFWWAHLADGSFCLEIDTSAPEFKNEVPEGERDKFYLNSNAFEKFKEKNPTSTKIVLVEMTYGRRTKSVLGNVNLDATREEAALNLCRKEMDKHHYTVCRVLPSDSRDGKARLLGEDPNGKVEKIKVILSKEVSAAPEQSSIHEVAAGVSPLAQTCTSSGVDWRLAQEQTITPNELSLSGTSSASSSAVKADKLKLRNGSIMLVVNAFAPAYQMDFVRGFSNSEQYYQEALFCSPPLFELLLAENGIKSGDKSKATVTLVATFKDKPDRKILVALVEKGENRYVAVEDMLNAYAVSLRKQYGNQYNHIDIVESRSDLLQPAETEMYVPMAEVIFSKNFEVKNGLPGMNRDLICKLLKLLKDHRKVRNLVGMCGDTVFWATTPIGKWFLSQRLKGAPTDERINALALDVARAYYQAQWKGKMNLEICKRIGAEVVALMSIVFSAPVFQNMGEDFEKARNNAFSAALKVRSCNSADVDLARQIVEELVSEASDRFAATPVSRRGQDLRDALRGQPAGLWHIAETTPFDQTPASLDHLSEAKEARRLVQALELTTLGRGRNPLQAAQPTVAAEFSFWDGPAEWRGQPGEFGENIYCTRARRLSVQDAKKKLETLWRKNPARCAAGLSRWRAAGVTDLLFEYDGTVQPVKKIEEQPNEGTADVAILKDFGPIQPAVTNGSVSVADVFFSKERVTVPQKTVTKAAPTAGPSSASSSLANAESSNSSSDAANKFEFKNGLLGMNRDIVCKLLGLQKDHRNVRNLVGMCGEIVFWLKTRVCKWFLSQRLQGALPDELMALAKSYFVSLCELLPAEQIGSAGEKKIRAIMDLLMVLVKRLFTDPAMLNPTVTWDQEPPNVWQSLAQRNAIEIREYEAGRKPLPLATEIPEFIALASSLDEHSPLYNTSRLGTAWGSFLSRHQYSALGCVEAGWRPTQRAPVSVLACPCQLRPFWRYCVPKGHVCQLHTLLDALSLLPEHLERVAGYAGQRHGPRVAFWKSENEIVWHGMQPCTQASRLTDRAAREKQDAIAPSNPLLKFYWLYRWHAESVKDVLFQVDRDGHTTLRPVKVIKERPRDRSADVAILEDFDPIYGC
ncbi:hypothetical protein FACS189481_3640 [Clostridia bacterium]|nr:hypothetical protein FACS189481_3640 [Clostridia bacterium]